MGTPGQRGVGTTGRKVLRKLGQHSPFEFAFGWLLSRKFNAHGLVIARPGFPKPKVINDGGKILVGNCAFFPGVRLEVLDGGCITIGDGTYLNRNTLIVSARDVRIGRNCQIAWDVVIMDTDQHPVHGDERVAPVVIEDDVWIGCRAIVLKGVRIGAGAIIGAGSVVADDIPPGAVVAGPKARMLRRANGASPEAASGPSGAYQREPGIR